MLSLSGFVVCALFEGKVGDSTIVMQFSYNLPGVPGVQSQFIGPSNGICPGDDVTFT